MPGKVKSTKKAKSSQKAADRARVKSPSPDGKKSSPSVRSNGSRGLRTDGTPKDKGGARSKQADLRRETLHRMLMQKREEVLREIGDSLGHSLTEDQQRRLEAAMDVGDQAMMDLERELGISLLEMQNRKRQMIDEALTRLAEGTYGLCAECGVEISEKRLAAVPFAKLCVNCQSKAELIEKIEKEEERE
jgi:DnaK suppressor protein